MKQSQQHEQHLPLVKDSSEIENETPGEFQNHFSRPTKSSAAKQKFVAGTFQKSLVRRTEHELESECENSAISDNKNSFPSGKDKESILYHEPDEREFEILISMGERSTSEYVRYDMEKLKRVFREEYAVKYLESLRVEPSDENVSMV